MKISGRFVRTPLLLGVPVCALFLSAHRGWIPGVLRSETSAREDHVLKAGEVKHGVLELGSAHDTEYSLVVPTAGILVRVKLNCTQAELVLSARESDTGEDEDPDFKVNTDSGTATLSISRFTEPAIAAGRYRFRVAYRSHDVPRTVDRRIDRIPFSIEAEVFETRVDGTLRPGERTSGAITPESGSFRTYRIDVPPDAHTLRIDIAEAESDLDLFAQRGHPVRRLSDDVYFAQHNYGRETLVIDAGSSPPLEAGTWFVDVLDVFDDERPTTFQLLATFDAKPPRELLEIRGWATTPPPPSSDKGRESAGQTRPSGSGALSRALVGVVELSTDDGAGSGTLLTSDGWILTNAHVVTGYGSEVLKEVVISVPVDPHRPCVEMFRGRVDRVDKDRDLALVQVSSGFYGQPLPPGYVFPTVEMGEPDALAIGDPLWLVGYPSTGGQGSRVTITATRGVVSGFDTVDFGNLLKTDATITLGNSGGAALDLQGRIVGVPTSTVELGSGHIGYVHPLSMMPAEWMTLIRSRLQR
jgi:S1-C subfamily serine protease